MDRKKVIRAYIYPDRQVVKLIKQYKAVEQGTSYCTLRDYEVLKQANSYRIDFQEEINLSLGPRAN